MCDLDLTIDLVVVTLTSDMSFRFYLRNFEVQKNDTWWGSLVGSVSLQSHGLALF